jgi:hypothetical protein
MPSPQPGWLGAPDPPAEADPPAGACGDALVVVVKNVAAASEAAWMNVFIFVLFRVIPGKISRDVVRKRFER